MNRTVLTRNIDIDDIIDRIMKLQFNSSTVYFPLSEKEVQALCTLTRQTISIQPMLLELKPPINVCGDIHGQFHDLLKIIKMIGHPEKQNYLFLGDYVDRGKKSLECFCLLMAFKIKYQKNFFLLRGNHECSELNKIYGFYDQVKRKFNVKLWKNICNIFNYLPLAAVIGDRIFCVHGGLSPQLKDITDINSFKRPLQPLKSSAMCDMLWSDPSSLVMDWGENLERGISYTYGSWVIDQFLNKYDFDLICRSHQVVEEGYEFFHDRKLVTIFSAPNYCGDFQNLAAALKVDQDMKCSILQLNPNPDFKLQRMKRSLTPIPPNSKKINFSEDSTCQSIVKKKEKSRSRSPLKNHKQNTSPIEGRSKTAELSEQIRKTGRKVTNGKAVPEKQINIHNFSSQETFDLF